MVQTSKLFSQRPAVSNNSIFHAMCLSNWAYTRNNHGQDMQIANIVRMPVPVFQFLEGSNAPQWFIAQDAHSAQVAIAGTTNLNQWMDYITQAGVTNARNLVGKTFGPFDEWSDVITAEIFSRVDSKKEILISGHSLGGAMAIIVAEKLLKQGYDKIVVYTFGCPRVGDRDFVLNYESVVHNVRNQGDVVPSLPPAMLSYVRVLPSFRQVLPYLGRPGHEYVIPHGPRPWLNPSTLVDVLVPGAWVQRIPQRVADEHGEYGYLRSAWRLGNQRERFDAREWYSVCNGIWGVGLSPAP